MKKNKTKYTMLHQHQIANFIDNRQDFYNRYFLNIDPRQYEYKGVRKAFEIGTFIDQAVKEYYINKKPLNLNSIQGQKITKYDQVLISGILQAYQLKYNKNTEFFHSHKIINFKIPVKKYKFVIYCSPDMLAYTFHENELVVHEIKTKAQEARTQETLDFQTMCYCWASYRWNFKIPIGVIKRTIKKPRIKQTKKETEQDFYIRLLDDITDNPDKYITSNYRPINKEMILEFEKYLYEILKEMRTCLNSRNKYKFYRSSKDYWGS